MSDAIEIPRELLRRLVVAADFVLRRVGTRSFQGEQLAHAISEADEFLVPASQPPKEEEGPDCVNCGHDADEHSWSDEAREFHVGGTSGCPGFAPPEEGRGQMIPADSSPDSTVAAGGSAARSENGRAKTTEIIPAAAPVEPAKGPRCAHCGALATCLGRYESMTSDEYACDDCCGHGCEDGHCEPVAATSDTPKGDAK